MRAAGTVSDKDGGMLIIKTQGWGHRRSREGKGWVAIAFQLRTVVK